MSAATPARDTDSSVEEDPAAGRSVDRAPREGRSRARRDHRWTLRASGGAEGHHRKGANTVSDGGADSQSIVSSSHRWRRGRATDPVGESRSRTGPGPAERSPRGEERSERASAGRPANRRGPGARRARKRGNPLPMRTDGAPERKPIAERRTEARLRGADGTAGNGGTGSDGPTRSTCTSSSDGVGGKPEHGREAVAGDERQEGSRPQRCGTAADEEQAFAGWERQRGDRIRPEKLRLRRPIRTKPGEPGPDTGCNMPEAVNGGSRRGGEKPRGRSETDGVASVGRGKVLRNRPGVDVHGDIGRRAHGKGRSSRRGRSRAPRGERFRLGPAGTPEARPRWGGDATGIRKDLGACPDTSNREVPGGDAEGQDGASERPTTDGYRGEAGDRATSNTS